MKKQYQVTLISESGKYKPVSCIVYMEQAEDVDLTADKAMKSAIVKQGVIKIAQKRLWTGADLKKYGYTKSKCRLYDKEKIEAENAERYEKIKAERGWKQGLTNSQPLCYNGGPRMTLPRRNNHYITLCKFCQVLFI